jgi:hypothetical protein
MLSATTDRTGAAAGGPASGRSGEPDSHDEDRTHVRTAADRVGTAVRPSPTHPYSAHTPLLGSRPRSTGCTGGNEVRRQDRGAGSTSDVAVIPTSRTRARRRPQ